MHSSGQIIDVVIVLSAYAVKRESCIIAQILTLDITISQKIARDFEGSACRILTCCILL